MLRTRAVLVVRQRQLHEDESVGGISVIDRLQVDERAYQQARRRDDGDRERHLKNHERPARPPPGTAERAAATAAERRGDVSSRQQPCRNETSDRCGQTDAGGDRGHDNAVDADGVKPRESFGETGDQRTQRPPGERDAHGAGGQRQ